MVPYKYMGGQLLDQKTRLEDSLRLSVKKTPKSSPTPWVVGLGLNCSDASICCSGVKGATSKETTWWYWTCCHPSLPQVQMRTWYRNSLHDYTVLVAQALGNYPTAEENSAKLLPSIIRVTLLGLENGGPNELDCRYHQLNLAWLGSGWIEIRPGWPLISVRANILLLSLPWKTLPAEAGNNKLVIYDGWWPMGVTPGNLSAAARSVPH